MTKLSQPSFANPLKVWLVINHLGSEAEDFILIKAESENQDPEHFLQILFQPLGHGSSRTPMRNSSGT